MNSPKLCAPAGPHITGPVVLAVMDGVGLGRGDEADAVAAARTPTLDALMRGPCSLPLRAHGPAVGLATDADMGNSEVGHNALGAGRVFDQGAKRVAEAVVTGQVFAGPAWAALMARCVGGGGALHLLGLLSDGNVHSHIEHLLALVRRADAEGVARVFVHVLLDGRDVPSHSAPTYLAQLQAVLDPIDARPGRTYRIASGAGRMHATMDRYEADWPMVARGYNLHVRGVGPRFASAQAALSALRAETPGIGDQDLPGFVVDDGHGRAVGPVRDGDAMVAFNFRGDRMLQWVRTMEDETMDAFARGPRLDVLLVGMTLYDGDSGRPRHFLVAPPRIEHTLGELMADAGIAQLACSETQKFGHVTYFWNGNRAEPFDAKLERYIEVPSLTLPFAQQPQMRAHEIVQAVVQALGAGLYGFARLNLANGDMVGHTGDFAATVAAVEAVDAALGTLRSFVQAAGGALIVTADHGNAEDMGERDAKTQVLRRTATGGIVPKPSHSTNPVPCCIEVPLQLAGHLVRTPAAEPSAAPGLTNLAATVLALMGRQGPPGHFDAALVRWTAL